jgi:hypothetical protein
LAVGDARLILEESPRQREGPCALRIASTRANARLDPQRTHGAAIELAVDR